MSRDREDPSPDLPTTPIARIGPSEGAAAAVPVILAGEADDWVIIKCSNLLGNRLGRNPDQRKQCGKYVGVHAMTLLPVFTTGSTFLQGYDKEPCAAKDIIFDEQLLRSNGWRSAESLKATSVVVSGGAETAHKRRQRFPAQPEQPERAKKRPRLTNDGTEAPNPMPLHMLPLRLGSIEEYRQGEFFHLAIPCLGSTRVPEALIDLARAMQAKLAEDNINLNVVVMAIIIWVDIHADPRQKGRGRFPRRYLDDFVCFWPHFLRFHEVFHLPVYCHPCQFMSAVWGPSTPSNENFEWEKEAKALVDLCRLGPRTDYAQMLPSSWPGSTLTFPADAEDYGFAVPSAALARRLGQPSIHTIGHPAYPEDSPRAPQPTTLLLPRTWVSPAIKSAVSLTTTTISSEVIRPERGGSDSLRLITGEVLDIFPRPEDLEPLASIPTRPSPTQSPRPTTQQQEDHTNLHIDDRVGVFWEHFASPEFHQAQMEAQNSKLQAAIAAGVTIDQLTFDEHNLLSWPAVNPAATTPEPTPAPLLSAELAAEVRVAVITYLQSSHRHQEFQNFEDLVQTAEELEVAPVRTALKRAVHQTQVLKETMEEFVRSFHSQALIHDDPTDWTFCRAIAPKFLVPLLQLVGAEELATQPVQTLTPERVCEAVKGIVDVHKFTLNLLAPGTAVCEPGSRVLIDECIPLTTYWMKSLLKSFPFQMLEIFQKLLESFPEDD